MTRIRTSRSSSSETRNTHSWDTSLSSRSSGYSAASSNSSSGSGRSPLSAFALAIGSCFVLPVKDELSDDAAKPTHQCNLSVDSNSHRSDRRQSSNRRQSSERRRSGKALYISEQSLEKESEHMTFTYSDILKATKNFSPISKIGQGGFGTVYKGKLNDGTLVAIKRAKRNVHDVRVGAQFQTEIKTMSTIEHLSLVRLFGFLEHEDERLIVIEYVANGTLREHLDRSENPLDLSARLDIAIDVGHAITYLHTYTDHPIIHRDIKSSNILLTENLRAKVADFGFARLGAIEADQTHVSTQVKGTAGYLDPDYLLTSQLTDKSDVYSFGVLLVELISGRRPIEPKRDLKERITVRWVMKKFTDGRSSDILDPNIEQSPSTNVAVENLLDLAIQCLAPNRHNRPCMKQCVEFLWGVRKQYSDLLTSGDLLTSSGDLLTSIPEVS